MKEEELPALAADLDCRAGRSQSDQLPAGDHTVLPPRDRRDLPVEQPSVQFDPTIALKCTLDLHPARVASPV